MNPGSHDAEKISTNNKRVIPDGGYGWVVTFASFMCHFIADGLAFSFGVIFSELVNTFDSSKSTTSWIASLSVGVPMLSGPVAGLFVNRYGCRPAAIMGGLITSAGLFASSFVNSIEMLTVTYGIVAGFGLAFVYVPASVIPSFWFEKRRSLATGIAVSGSGLGTFVIAPFMEYLLDQYGWRGTLLVMSGVTLNFLVFGALFREVSQSPIEAVSGLGKKVVSVDSLPSIMSFQTLPSIHESNGSTCSAVTVTPTPGSPTRMHHSTNTVFTGEEFELLYDCSHIQRLNRHPPPNPRNRTSAVQLLRSKQSLLPVSRRDIASVINLAQRQRTISSCPHLSTASDGEIEGGEKNDEDDKHCSKRTTKKNKSKLLTKVQHLAIEMCDIRLLAVPVYLLFLISNFMLSYAYDLPYLYLPDYAASLQIDRPSFLIAIIGIVNTFGQVIYGYLGDRKSIDTLLLYGVSIFFCGICVSLLPIMRSYPALATFSVVFGLLISANFSLETVVLVKILSLDQLTKAYGMLMFAQGMASLVGPPIGGMLWDVTGIYDYTFIFTGLSIIISGILATSIVFLRKSANHSRSVSESTDIASPPPHSLLGDNLLNT